MEHAKKILSSQNAMNNLSACVSVYGETMVSGITHTLISTIPIEQTGETF